MTISELQNEIIRLKKEKDICILAHSYQAREILEVADYTGDSYKLSVDASKAENKNIVMSGVRFMAETCKILAPEKKVYIPNPHAGCAMADQMDKQLISQVKKQYPDYTVVAYINTTADLKTICDVCVTSSSAVEICKKIENKNILFIPDCNLGDYVAKQIPDKNFKLLSGGCPIHACVNKDDVKKAKELYPDALAKLVLFAQKTKFFLNNYQFSIINYQFFAIFALCYEQFYTDFALSAYRRPARSHQGTDRRPATGRQIAGALGCDGFRKDIYYGKRHCQREPPYPDPEP